MTTTDAQVIAQAFVRHRLDVYRFLLRRTRDHHEAEELTQQVFADAAASMSRGGAPRSLQGWLYAVAERRLVDELRRRARDAQIASLLAGEVDAVSTRPTQAAAVADAVAQLPDAQRRVVVMRVVEGRSHRDIARTLGCDEAACKMRLSRALRRLRNELGTAA